MVQQTADALKPFRGQGIAWDRHETNVLYGIIRATGEEEKQGISNKVTVFESSHPEGKGFHE